MLPNKNICNSNIYKNNVLTLTNIYYLFFIKHLVIYYTLKKKRAEYYPIPSYCRCAYNIGIISLIILILVCVVLNPCLLTILVILLSYYININRPVHQ